MLTLPPTSPFSGRLVELRDPEDSRKFEQDLSHWRLINPHMVDHSKIVHHIDKKLLIGTLQLGNQLPPPNFHLLTVDVIR